GCAAGAGTIYSGLHPMLGNSDGSFRCDEDDEIGLGAELVFTAVADLSHDGLPDLASINRQTNEVLVLLNDGNWRGGGGAPSDGHFLDPVVPRNRPMIPDLSAAEALRGDVDISKAPCGHATRSTAGERLLLLFEVNPQAAAATSRLDAVSSRPASGGLRSQVKHAVRELRDLGEGFTSSWV